MPFKLGKKGKRCIFETLFLAFYTAFNSIECKHASPKLHSIQRALRDAHYTGFSREISALCTACPGCAKGNLCTLHSQNTGFSWGNLCTLHSVPWLRDAQNAGFSGEISALYTACPGCAMLKMLDFLGKSLHFTQRVLAARSSKCWICLGKSLHFAQRALSARCSKC